MKSEIVTFPVMYHSMAAISAFGGYVGYARKGSRPSLIAGLTVAAVYESSVYLMSQDSTKQLYGIVLGTAISSLLAIRMGKRALTTGKVIPGTIAVSAFLVASVSVYQAFKRGN